MGARSVSSCLLVGAALAASIRGAADARYLAGFALAVIAFWAWGRVALPFALGNREAGPLTTLYLGQLFALSAAPVLFAVQAGLAALRAPVVPLPVLVLGPPFAAEAWRWRRSAAVEHRWARAVTWPSPLLVAGLGLCGAAVATYARDLAALGLDVHQHATWAQRILRDGRIALAEPGTPFLSAYPRSFHTLTALWGAAALTPAVGPWVKVMPFLQSALPVLAAGELMAGARSSAAGRARAGVLAVTFLVYAGAVVPLVYPAYDLSGTPRLSSGCLLLLPVLLVLAAVTRRSAVPTELALAILPLAAARALTWNPVTAVGLVTCSIPTALALAVTLRVPRPRLRRVARLALAAGALAFLVVAEDPWLVAQAAPRVPALSALLRRAGLMTREEGVRRGLASDTEFSVAPEVPPPPCSARCVLAVTRRAAAEAIDLPIRAAQSGVRDVAALVRAPGLTRARDALAGATPLQPAAFAPWAALPVVALVVAALAGLTVRAVQRRPWSFDEKLLAGAVGGTVLAGVLTRFAANVAGALTGGSHLRQILAGYLASTPRQVSLTWLWLGVAAAALVLFGRAAPRAEAWTAGRRRHGARTGLTLAVVALLLAAPQLVRRNFPSPRQLGAFWTPLTIADLDALRAVERAVPTDDAVLVPSDHWNIEGLEHWIIPQGGTTSLLPYGTRRYLFNVSLGAGNGLSWRDLEDGPCNRDPAARRRFDDRHRVRWVLVRASPTASPSEALRTERLCDVPLAAFGAWERPVASERGVHLFRWPDPPDVPGGW